MSWVRNKELIKVRSYQNLSSETHNSGSFDFRPDSNIESQKNQRPFSRPTPLFGEKGGNKLKRIKSTQMFMHNEKEKDMAQVYEEENRNLKKQNKFLAKELEKRKQTEKALHIYIKTLSQKIANIKQKQNMRQGHSQHRLGGIEKSGFDSMLSTGIFLPQDESLISTAEQIQQLNKKFTELLDKSFHEQNKQKRSILRQKLAQTAQQLKRLKKRNKEY